MRFFPLPSLNNSLCHHLGNVAIVVIMVLNHKPARIDECSEFSVIAILVAYRVLLAIVWKTTVNKGALDRDSISQAIVSESRLGAQTPDAGKMTDAIFALIIIINNV